MNKQKLYIKRGKAKEPLTDAEIRRLLADATAVKNGDFRYGLLREERGALVIEKLDRAA